MVETLVVRAYDALMQAAMPESLRSFFEISRDDLVKLVIARRGGDPDVVDARKAKRQEKEPKPGVAEIQAEETEPISAWMRIECGIIIPKTTEL